VTHPQVLTNPHFNTGLSGWTVIQQPGSTVTWSDGVAFINRPSGGGVAAIQQTVMVVGAPYEARAYLDSNGGGMSWGAQSAGVSLTGTGLKIRQFTATHATFVISASSLVASARINYVELRRLDVSMSKVILTLRDYDGDKKQTSVELGPVTDGASYVTREGQAAALRDAVNAVAGNIAQYDFLAQSTEPNNINTALPVFQTHIRWIVELFDSVTGDGPYAFDIPTADLGNGDLVLPSSVEHDPAAAEWIALKAALNGIAINPRTGSTMTVGRIYLEE